MKQQRWTSETFRIYSPNCKELVFLQTLNKGCKLDNYTFGPGQNELQTFSDLKDLTQCFGKCIKLNCISYSWDTATSKCTISTSTNLESIYLCQQPNSTVSRSEIVCKEINQLDSEDKVWEKSWLKYSNSSQNVQDLGECTVLCNKNNCTFFSWNKETRECELVHDLNTEVSM